MASQPHSAATPSRLAPTVAPAREALCGTHIGDRRVRVQRPPRTVAQKVASVIRRTLHR